MDKTRLWLSPSEKVAVEDCEDKIYKLRMYKKKLMKRAYNRNYKRLKNKADKILWLGLASPDEAREYAIEGIQQMTWSDPAVKQKALEDAMKYDYAKEAGEMFQEMKDTY